MRLFTLTILALLSTNIARAGITPVPYVDVARYIGDWYQIAHNPLPFDRDCYCARQRLTLRDDGLVGVYNSCNKGSAKGPLNEIRGTAANDDPKSNSRFTVDFNLPNKGQYWIIGLDEDYRFAVVSEPSERSLYILSKTPEISRENLLKALDLAAAQTSISNLQYTFQSGCEYPQ